MMVEQGNFGSFRAEKYNLRLGAIEYRASAEAREAREARSALRYQ